MISVNTIITIPVYCDWQILKMVQCDYCNNTDIVSIANIVWNILLE